MANAGSAYAPHFFAAQMLIAEIEDRLAEHAKRAAAEPSNWGFVGDVIVLGDRLRVAVKALAAPAA